MENTYFKRALQHSNYGSVVNYQQVRVVSRDDLPNEHADLTKLKVDVRVLQGKVSELMEEKEEKEEKQEEEEEKKKKRKKPDVPAHRPKGPQFVVLKDKHGNEHRLQKLPRGG